MKNKYIYKLILIFFFSFIISKAISDEQFQFDVTEIEIQNNGKLFKGLKRGTIKTNDGIIIIADTFIYNKETNIINAEGNVKFDDTLKNYNIFSDKITYLKNEEILFSEGNSRAIDENNKIITADNFKYNKIENILNAEGTAKIEDNVEDYIIYSENITYYRNEEKVVTIGKTQAKIKSKYDIESKDVLYLIQPRKLSSNFKSVLKDDNSQIYYLDQFVYFLNDNLLKGKNVLTITNYNLPKSDKFYFSEGMFNLKDKKFTAKETKINIHKDVFNEKENDPRIYGVSSRGSGKLTTIKKGVFTSCKKRDGCPPWIIKSDIIEHDREKKQIAYKNAFLKIYDVPILYFPKFFHPDPSVNRQSGLLTPRINNSDVLGSSLTLPYFKVISQNKDFTFKPSWFDNDILSFQNEFRQQNNNSSFLADFGFVKGYRSSTTKDKNSLSHLFTNFDLDLNLKEFNSSKLFFSFEQVSNDSYLKIFDAHITKSKARPDDLDTLDNQIKLTLNHDKYDFESGFHAYESLGVRDSDRYQYVLPYYNFSTVLEKKYLNGSVGFSSNGSNNLNNTNDLKSRIVNNINYQTDKYITNSGIANNFNIDLKNLNSLGKKNSDYKSSPQMELVSIFSVNTSFPLIRKEQKYTDYLTPKLSLRFNPSDMKDYSNSGKTIDVGNIFSVTRLGLGDTFESGRSLTLGLDYKRENKKLNDINNFFEMKLATVIRDKEESFIPKESTINRKTSNIFGSIKNKYSDIFELDYDFSIDNDLSTFERNSIGTTFKLNNIITTFNFTEENGIMGDTNVFNTKISYNIDDSNYIKFHTRRNRKINLTEYYDLVYEYKNDCLTAGVKYNKTYYSDGDIKPTENLLFTVTLFPLTTYEHDAGDLLKNEDSFLKNLELDSRMFK